MKTIRQTETFAKWLGKLADRRARGLITKRLRRLANGNPGDSKRLAGANGVQELRIDHGPGYRVYFIERGAEIVILLCGGDKGSQDRDIAKAKQLAVEED